MICLKCDWDLPAEHKEALFPSLWRGCLLLVPAPARVCPHCGEAYLDNDGIDAFCRNTKATYEKNMRFLSLCLSRCPELATLL